MAFRSMVVAAALTTLGAMPVFLLSAQFVLVRRDLGLDERQLGVAVGVFFAAAAAASPVMGLSADRLRLRTSMVLAGGLAAASALVIATMTHTFAVLLAMMAFAGLANAALQMTANAVLTGATATRHQGLAFGVKQSAVPAAMLLGGLAVPTIGVAVGWRWTFGVLAGIALLMAVLGLRSRSDPGQSRPRPTVVDRAPRGALIVIAVANTIGSGVLTAVATILPVRAFDLGVAPGTAGLVLAVASALCVGGRIASGYVADRRGGRNLTVVAVQLVVGAGGLLLLAAGTVPMLLAGWLVSFAIGWSWPGVLLFAVVRSGRDRPMTASGAVQAGAFCGGALGPILFVLAVRASDYGLVWRASAGLLILAAALVMLAQHMFLEDIRRRPPASDAALGSR